LIRNGPPLEVSGAAISRLLASAEGDGEREKEAEKSGQIGKHSFGSFGNRPGKWRWLLLEVATNIEEAGIKLLVARSGCGK